MAKLDHRRMSALCLCVLGFDGQVYIRHLSPVSELLKLELDKCRVCI